MVKQFGIIILIFLLSFNNCIRTTGELDKSTKVYQRIINTGYNGIEGRKIIPSLKESDGYIFTFNEEGQITIIQYRSSLSKIPTPFIVPEYFEPFQSDTISQIKIKYSKNLTTFYFINSNGDVLFEQQIAKKGPKNRLVNITYKGNATNRIDKCYLIFNEKDHLIERRLFKSGELTSSELYHDDIEKRAAVIKWDYQNNLPIKQKNYYTDSTLWDYIVWEYDFDGRIIKENFYDEVGNPKKFEEEYFSKTIEYRDQENLIVESYYDSDGHLVDAGFGYAIKKRYTYDNQNVKEEYLNQSGDLIDGCAKKTRKENIDIGLIITTCLDKNGNVFYIDTLDSH